MVLKLSGHLVAIGDKINYQLIADYAKLLRELYDGKGKWVVVVGGGEIARRYVDAARMLGADEVMCDEVAILVTRANAKLMTICLGDLAQQRIPTSTEELRELATNGKIVVMGGLQPGQSTIAVAALAASVIKAERLIVTTDVDGIYTSDPKIDPNAKPLSQVSLSDLSKMVAALPQNAGKYPLIDNLAIAILRRSKITCVYLNGRKLEDVKKAIMGEKVGTLVIP
ncbi:MAG: UMP kinase [Nitrososphaerota archaeon]|nr:UMP kinase [Aigarchaeota archaeon]MDW8076644.1 UMP kinase [Nitrososphaerota archaeon]